MTKPYPEHICHDCGARFCKGLVSPAATFYLSDCQCCGASQVPCTEPRDYGQFVEWPLPRHVDPSPAPLEVADLIEPVLKDFDFEQTHKAMTALRWQWFDGEGPDRVPTIEQLRQKSRSLLVSVVNSRRYFVTGTGGLWVEKVIDDNIMDCGLILRFILDTSEHYIGDYHDEPA